MKPATAIKLAAGLTPAVLLASLAGCLLYKATHPQPHEINLPMEVAPPRPLDPQSYRQALVDVGLLDDFAPAACPGRTATTISIGGVESDVAYLHATRHLVDSSDEWDEWTRENWDALLNFAVTEDAFTEHFAPIWRQAIDMRRDGPDFPSLHEVWSIPGVRAVFRVIQDLRSDLLWELSALEAEHTEQTRAMEEYLRGEVLVIAELAGVGPEVEKLVNEERAASAARCGQQALSQE